MLLLKMVDFQVVNLLIDSTFNRLLCQLEVRVINCLELLLVTTWFDQSTYVVKPLITFFLFYED